MKSKVRGTRGSWRFLRAASRLTAWPCCSEVWWRASLAAACCGAGRPGGGGGGIRSCSAGGGLKRAGAGLCCFVADLGPGNLTDSKLRQAMDCGMDVLEIAKALAASELEKLPDYLRSADLEEKMVESMRAQAEEVATQWQWAAAIEAFTPAACAALNPARAQEAKAAVEAAFNTFWGQLPAVVKDNLGEEAQKQWKEKEALGIARAVLSKPADEPKPAEEAASADETASPAKKHSRATRLGLAHSGLPGRASSKEDGEMPAVAYRGRRARRSGSGSGRGASQRQELQHCVGQGPARAAARARGANAQRPRWVGLRGLGVRSGATGASVFSVLVARWSCRVEGFRAKFLVQGQQATLTAWGEVAAQLRAALVPRIGCVVSITNTGLSRRATAKTDAAAGMPDLGVLRKFVVTPAESPSPCLARVQPQFAAFGDLGFYPDWGWACIHGNIFEVLEAAHDAVEVKVTDGAGQVVSLRVEQEQQRGFAEGAVLEALLVQVSKKFGNLVVRPETLLKVSAAPAGYALPSRVKRVNL